MWVLGTLEGGGGVGWSLALPWSHWGTRVMTMVPGGSRDLGVPEWVPRTREGYTGLGGDWGIRVACV